MSAPPADGTIAFFGGSFNPPHVSHVLAVAYVLATEPIEHVLVVPTHRHALGKESGASFEHRVEMCRLAMSDLARTSVSRVEEELGGTSYTLTTLEELQKRSPGARFRLLVGADILAEVDKWHRFDLVAEIAPLLVVGRCGYGAPAERGPAVELPPVSSTEIRARLARRDDVTGLVPHRVLAYIEQHRLYGSEPSE